MTRATRHGAIALNRVLVGQFITMHVEALGELNLDVDASDVPLHGEQELSQLHGYGDHYGYLPLHVFCGQSMLTLPASAIAHRRCETRGSHHSGCWSPAAANVNRVVVRHFTASKSILQRLVKHAA